jgi:hypothetical protein
MRARGMTSLARRASILAMKILRSQLPAYIASFCIASAAALGGCASDDGTEDPAGDGDGDMASGGAASGGGAATGGAAATGGTTGTGGTDGSGGSVSANELPSDISEAGIAAFLTAGTYKATPWIGDAAPRASDNPVNIHGAEIRVFFNSAAAASVTRNDNTSDMGTMVVKELYDAGAVVGHAVSIKTGAGNTMSDWTYYCSAPAGSTACTGGAAEETFFGEGLTECGFCHGQQPYAPLPQ